MHALWGWIALGAAAAVALAQLLRYPRQVIGWLFKSAVLGLLFIYAVNWVGQQFHFHLPLNPMTAFTAGFLGIPGLVALMALHLWLYT